MQLAQDIYAVMIEYIRNAKYIVYLKQNLNKNIENVL